MIELTFLKESMLTKQVHQKECDVCCRYWYLKLYLIRFQPKVYNRCHNLLMISVNLSDISILNIKSSD